MFKLSKTSHPLLAALTIAGVFAAAPAFAGECPADKMKPNVREKVDYKPVGVTDVTLGSINLEKGGKAWNKRKIKGLQYATIV